jgi:quercetin dioxygenase-like cupin family protein
VESFVVLKGYTSEGHVHTKTTQKILVVIGVMEYWWKTVGEDCPWKMKVVGPGDMVTTPAGEAHLIKAASDLVYITTLAASDGLCQQGKDTFLVNPEA